MKNFKFKPIDKDHLMQMSITSRNFEAMKKVENQKALIEYGFSNIGELREIKERKVEPFKVGVWNLLRQVMP
jgi:hypothetical protein